MSATEQYREYLTWLKAKQREAADAYWQSSRDAQRQYQIVLLKIQAEILTTEETLKGLHA